MNAVNKVEYIIVDWDQMSLFQIIFTKDMSITNL